MSSKLKDQSSAGQAHRDRQAQKSREQSKAVADIGDIPEITDPERREACKGDPELFAKTYFSHVPYGVFMPIEDMHREILHDFDEVALHGGSVSIAAPRSGGKTTCAIISIIRAQVYGFVKSDVYACENKDLAVDRLALIKRIYETNDMLLEDFPEVCYPIRCLEGKPQRQTSQMCNGELTDIKWTATQIALPKIRDQKTGKLTPGSGCRLTVAGMESGVRGILDEVGRPDRVIIDDPQGDDAASSLVMRGKRRKIIGKALGELGSQYSNLAMIMLCTIIEPGDIADEFTDREMRPEWGGRRYKYMPCMPTRMDLWDKYIAMRQEDQRGGDRYARRAHKYYLKNRKKMDAGCVLTLPNAYAGKHVIIPPMTKTKNALPDGTEIEASAIQSAFNVIAKRDGPEIFACEYQNDPILPEGSDHDLNVKDLCERTNGYKRNQIPIDAQTITTYVDIQGRLLYYVVVAWAQDFTGYVVDYGTWPEQKSKRFTAGNAQQTYARAKPGAGFEGQLYNALEKFTDELMDHVWKREDNARLQVSLCMFDAAWGESTDIVFQFCRQSRHAARLMPAYGKYYGAKSKPFNEVKKQKGEMLGLRWKIPSPRGRRQVRYMIIDTNYWKTFTAVRLKTVIGDRGAITFFGKRGTPNAGVEHEMFLEHLASEKCVEVEAKERKVSEWDTPPHAENHWWDCLVGCGVAASKCGVKLAGDVHQDHNERPKRKRMSLANARNRRR